MVLPFSCISLDHLKLFVKPPSWRKPVHPYAAEYLIQHCDDEKFRSTDPAFEFSVDDAVLKQPPFKDGVKTIAEFIVTPDSTSSTFLQALNDQLFQLLRTTAGLPLEDCAWTPILRLGEDAGDINHGTLRTYLRFNAQGQPFLPCRNLSTKTSLSLYQLKYGTSLRLTLSIPHLYLIRKAHPKNKTGKHKCGALTTIKTIEIFSA